MRRDQLAAILTAGTIGFAVLSGCAAGGTGPSTTSAPLTTQVSTTAAESMSVTATESTIDQEAVQRAAAQAAAQSAAAQAASNEAARVAAQSAADQAAADAAQQAANALYASGWYDEHGWVAPESAARARDAGIAAGGSVPDSLRCGTRCGEPPTSGELQQQLLDEQELSNQDGYEDESCTGGYPAGGICYPNYEAAAVACGRYLIRGNCYESAEAARAAGEGE